MCNCISEMNARLKEHPDGDNTYLVSTLIGTPMVLIATCKRRDSVRKKASKVLATYCPFCGEKYERAQMPAAHGNQAEQAPAVEAKGA